MRWFSASCFALLLVHGTVSADVKPNNLFTDYGVLQRNCPIPVWGTADPGEEVTVAFRQEKMTVKAGPDGKWMVKLPPQEAGGPNDLVISGKNKLVLHDVLVGEVLICSGQSNMEWRLSITFNADWQIS